MKKPKLQFLNFFHANLLRLGGYSVPTARSVDGHHQIRYAAFGLSLVVAAFIAAFGMWHTVRHYGMMPILSLACAAAWGLVILAFEYVIVVFLDKKSARWVAPVRYLMALIIALSVGLPLILSACAGPIQEQISNQTSKAVRVEDSTYHANKAALIEAPLAHYYAEVQKWEDSLVAEVSGYSGGDEGFGEDARAKKKARDNARDQYERLSAEKHSELYTLTNDHEAEKARIRKTAATDEAAQVRALFQILNDPAVLFRVILITLLILCLETIPLTVKLLNPPSDGDPYQREVKQQALEYAARNAAERQHRHRQAQADRALDSQVQQASHRTKVIEARTTGAVSQLLAEGGAISAIYEAGEDEKDRLRAKMLSEATTAQAIAHIDVLIARQIDRIMGSPMNMSDFVQDIPASPVSVAVDNSAQPHYVYTTKLDSASLSRTNDSHRQTATA